jgi:hypothetical protein
MPSYSIDGYPYLPLHMLELRVLAGLQETLPDLADMKKIINIPYNPRQLCLLHTPIGKRLS